jgi:hypothetical protein
MNINEFRITYALPTYLCKIKRWNNIDQSYVYFDNFWEKCRCLILILFKKAEKRKEDDEPIDPETPRNKDLKYDRKKRTRTFQNSWIDKFPWVVFLFEENTQEMYCKYCRKCPHLLDMKDALTRGTKNLRIDGLKLHDKHQEHLLCATRSTISWLPLNQPPITQQGTPEQEETIDSDRSEPRRTHTNIPSSRNPSGNGTKYHLQL